MNKTMEIATYNLGAVLEETGLKPDTLRAWERRYGLPQPQRSNGGHRLYTRRDIDIVKWLMQRQEERMSISKAVGMWHALESAGEDPLKQLAAPPMSIPTPPLPGGDPSLELLADVRDAWVAACERFDEKEADAILAHSFALFSPESVCVEVLLGGLAQLGAGWYQGEVIVQQEHFATELAKRRLEALIQATPQPTRRHRIMVTAPSGEAHDLVLLLLVLILRRRSLEVIHLGSNMPEQHLVSVVKRTGSTMVVSSAQRLRTAAALQQMSTVLAAEGIPLLYGGRIFNQVPRLRQRIAGHFIGDHLDAVVPQVESHLTDPQPIPQPAATSAVHKQALEAYRAQLHSIEAEALRLVAERLKPRHLATANLHLAQDIEAALMLDDMGLMASEIKWIEGLLDNHHIPRDQLHAYLSAYKHAVHQFLEGAGQPIIDWFDSFVVERELAYSNGKGNGYKKG